MNTSCCRNECYPYSDTIVETGAATFPLLVMPFSLFVMPSNRPRNTLTHSIIRNAVCIRMLHGENGSCILWGTSTDIPVYTSVDTRTSIGRYSTNVWNDTRSRLGQVPADSPVNDAHGVGQRIDRDTVDAISINHRLYNCRSSLGRLSVYIWVDTSVDARTISFNYLLYIGRY